MTYNYNNGNFLTLINIFFRIFGFCDSTKMLYCIIQLTHNISIPYFIYPFKNVNQNNPLSTIVVDPAVKSFFNSSA